MSIIYVHSYQVICTNPQGGLDGNSLFRPAVRGPILLNTATEANGCDLVDRVKTTGPLTQGHSSIDHETSLQWYRGDWWGYQTVFSFPGELYTLTDMCSLSDFQPPLKKRSTPWTTNTLFEDAHCSLNCMTENTSGVEWIQFQWQRAPRNLQNSTWNLQYGDPRLIFLLPVMWKYTEPHLQSHTAYIGVSKSLG